MAKRTRQIGLALRYKGRGGPRAGAGRPKKAGAGVSHGRRPMLSPHHPAHLTLRVVSGVSSLRAKKCFRAVARAFAHARDRSGFGVVHFSVQSNHLHLIVEADDRLALSRGMRGLAIRLARAVNRPLERRGTVFADRYHAHVLRSRREAANAIAYVLGNRFVHAARRGEIHDPEAIDRCSSSADRSLVVPARTWLLRIGWFSATRGAPPGPGETAPPSASR